jgi:hypothetical protein
LEVLFDAAVYSIFVKIRPIQPSVIANHSQSNDQRLTNIVANSKFRWSSNEEKISTLENLVSLGILKRDREIPLTDFPKLAKDLLKEAGIQPNTRMEVAGNQVPLPEDIHSLSVPGAAFVIACRPLDKRP